MDISQRVQALPSDGSIPALPDWRWIHTPGHTEGHVSLFRDADRVIVAGDAFITVKQESAFAVLMQEEEIHGPPAYFMFDWQDAWNSVKKLEALKPQAAITGHGVPMFGNQLRQGLARLAQIFDRIAIPKDNSYVT
ncbi:MBL fold metallo-hydrolase [Paenibacillus sp. MMS18-CY102]|uniref:MBL fold metallo-hydrolase n=1 Tax=Paenibacillus sp. MMS18-CY102 TaxID=2682849 RepID=UPI0013658095|nr:MBL fold metallo-hydrolase [Paenibacillus sp. MMS18-CY102]